MSTFSILSWCFFLIAAVTALILTTMSTPLIRRYRGVLLSLVASSLLLGITTSLTPVAMRKWNPDQSRLVPLDQLTLTQWSEPVANPETTLLEDEVSWLKNIPYRFRYKLAYEFDAKKIIAIQDSVIMLLDQGGNLRGFDAYSGINHWSIELESADILHTIQVQKKFFLLDRTRSDSLRITCLDLQGPAILWQRLIPNSKEGKLSFDFESQSLLVTTGENGIWSLKSKTGEILWKRPEIYTKTLAIPSLKHILVFEPVVAKRAGSWYFLNSQNGHTLQKIPHVFPEIQNFALVESNHETPQFFLAQVNDTQLFYMNHLDLTQGWSSSSQEPILFTQFIDTEHFFVMHHSNLLEIRANTNDQLVWQKKLSHVDPQWLRLTPDKKFFVLPNKEDHETGGVSFFSVETGDYLFTAKTSEPIIDMIFYGDWFYLMSENHLWSFQKDNPQKDTK